MNDVRVVGADGRLIVETSPRLAEELRAALEYEGRMGVVPAETFRVLRPRRLIGRVWGWRVVDRWPVGPRHENWPSGGEKRARV